MSNTPLEQKIIKNIRVLAMEEITNVGSGHPGIALGAAPIMFSLYSKILKKNSSDATWHNRDRFVLAAGHGSSLLYVMLHLAGYGLTIDDLKKFRQLHSLTPGHPELGITAGVDASSGPLGQGIPQACGMALAESFLEARYNRDIKLVDHYTYVLCGDGDLQEGVTNEALSIIGREKLNKLIIIHDSNDIQLDGKVSNAFNEDLKKKMESLHINYIRVDNGEDVEAIIKAVEKAKQSDLPSFIEVKTVIGYGAKNQGDSSVHGAPLPKEEVEEMRNSFEGKPFDVSEEAYEYFYKVSKYDEEVYLKELENEKAYAKKYPDLYEEYMQYLNGENSITKEELNIPFDKDYNKATRNAAGMIATRIGEMNPNFIGGAADLSKSTGIKGNDGAYDVDSRLGRNIAFGVREHAMAAICNGIMIHGVTRPICSGFFVFSDYLKPALRMSALQNLGVIYCFSHDSIAVGEDGPTHEPIEQLTMLRAIPNVNVIRPCGLEETKEAFVIAYNKKQVPTVIVTSRQGMGEYRTEANSKENLTSKGAYIISKEEGKLDAVIFATGSEVELAMKAKAELAKEGKSIRVVSAPCINLFDLQPKEYKESVLNDDVFTLGLEMGDATHLYKYIKNGKILNITTFGYSGKNKDVMAEFGFTVDNVVKIIKENI